MVMTESKAPLRAGVIGCGFFAQNHLHAWRHIPDVQLAAVCDIEPEKARAAAQQFEVEAWFEDAATMFNEAKLDFVDIATTPPSHQELVTLAAEHGLPTICQKPMALDLRDAEAIVATVRRAGIPFMVHENFRWQAPMRVLRRHLDEGAIGRPFYGQISWRTGFDIFSNQPYLLEQSRLVLADMGGHLIDVARFFLGLPRALACHTLKVYPGLLGEDVATILLEFENASGIVDMTYSGRAAEELFPQTIVHLEGEDGALDLGPHYQITVSNRDGAVEREQIQIPQYPWSIPLWDVVQDSVVRIQTHWVESLRTGRTPENSAEENLETYRLVEGAYISAETGIVYRADSVMEATAAGA
jgi:predicted dehydrogenase